MGPTNETAAVPLEAGRGDSRTPSSADDARSTLRRPICIDGAGFVFLPPVRGAGSPTAFLAQPAARTVPFASPGMHRPVLKSSGVARSVSRAGLPRIHLTFEQPCGPAAQAESGTGPDPRAGVGV